MPNLPGRYEHSIAKGEERERMAPVAFEAGALVPCLGGCGELVGAGQKCVDCATAAVVAWRARAVPISSPPTMEAKPEPRRRARR